MPPMRRIGEPTAANLLPFARRLAAGTANWPSVLLRLAMASAGLGAGDIVTKVGGAVVASPPSRPAWWPVYEVFVEDLYRFSELAGLRLGPGDVFLDLGAHIGAAAIRASQLWPAATVVCIEPDPLAFGYLKRNVASNEVRAELHEVAVGASDGRATLSGAGTASCEASTALDRPGATLEVEVVAASRLLAEAPGRARVVKMDCEGAEHEVLSAARPEEWAGVDVLLLEHHGDGGPETGWDVLEARAGSLGLATRWHVPFEWRPGVGMACFVRR